MNTAMKHKHLITFGSVMVVAWVLSTFLFVYFWPHLVNNIYKKAILNQGFGEGPVPINTLYTEPQQLFAKPLTAQPASGTSASGSKLMTTGVNHDTLLTVGWLDLSKGPLVLHVPDFSGPDSSGRYYSIQFTDPFDVDFAYVGTRTTGTQAGDYLVTGPTWQGQAPGGMKQIASPDNSVLVIGRILVYSDSDLPTAYGLAKQIQLTLLSQWKPNKSQGETGIIAAP
jgi:hypothetical protein